jgi:hypothetical protein
VGKFLTVIGCVVLAAIAGAAPAGAAGAGSAVPHYDHVLVIIEENHGYSDVIGNPAAPNLNALATRFGVATRYFGITHPSEPNYVALLGGSFFGIQSDDPYWMNRVHAPSLISQLDHARVSWKAYLQGLPHPGYKDICYPAFCNGAPDKDPLYASKHDGIQNFTGSLNRADWSRQVPVGELSRDLRRSHVPKFSLVIPDECHDQHGDPPYCIDGGNPFDPQDQHLVGLGDAYLGHLVSEITHASFWSHGNNAIVVTYDEGDDNAGCCDANPGGGQVATVVVTSHGPRGVKDGTPSNHYSLLQTIERSFGLGCLAHACDTGNVHALTPLFKVTGAPAIATAVLPIPPLPTPTPTPNEPMSFTTQTPSSARWSVLRSPLLGTNDNSLGAVSGTWAVGDFLPDTPASNQDATLTLADHWNGHRWTAVPTPNTGPNFNTLFGLATASGRGWAVGVTLSRRYHDRALIEAWNGRRWSIVPAPQPGETRDILFAAAATSTHDVWAVGDREGRNQKFETLVEHWNGHRWAVVPSPNPGSSGNHLYGVAAAGPDDVWAVGQRLDRTAPDHGLIEHWNGHRWSVVPSAAAGGASVLLDAAATGAGGPWAVGESDDEVAGARPFVERWHGGAWHRQSLPPAGSAFTSLFGVATSGDTAWVDGTYEDAAGNEETLMLRHRHGWSVVGAPNPGSGGNILGGITSGDHGLLAVGLYDTGNQNLTLIEQHH